MELELQNYQNRHSIKSKIGRVLWNIVWLLLFRPTPQRGIALFNAWRIFLLRLFGAKIGSHCVVMSSVEIWQPWNLEIGNWVALSEKVNCYSVDKITIGDRTTISREVFLCCASHDVRSPIMELTHASITIGSDAWVAAHVIVLPGRKIGEGSVVAAGSVVVKDVAPWTVVGGNPARFISERKFER